MFDDLDKILEMRAAPAAPSNLSARIIDHAARIPQQAVRARDFGLRALWDELLEMLSLPAPAYAFALVLVLGLGVGALADMSYILPGITTNDLSDLMAIEDHFVAGEWL